MEFAGSLVGIDPEAADVLARELRAAERELLAAVAEVRAVLDEVGEASFAPAELNQIANWCAEQAADVARRGASARCGPSLPAGPIATPGPGTLPSAGQRAINVPAPRFGDILVTPLAPTLRLRPGTPPAARGPQALVNRGAPPAATPRCSPPEARGPVRDVSTGTEPSGEPGPSSRPAGRRTRIPPKASKGNRRNLERENTLAEVLAAAGYQVEQNPEVPGYKNPDYRIEGRIFDFLSPSTPTVRNIWSRVEEKVVLGQTQRVVVDLIDTPVTVSQLRKQFRDWPIKGLEEVLVVDRRGKVSRLWP